MRYLTIFALILVLASGLYFFGRETDESLDYDDELEESPSLTSTLPSPTKTPMPRSNPKRVTPKPTVPKKSLNFKQQTKANTFSTLENYNIQDPDGNIYITHVQIDGEELIAHGDLIVGQVEDLEKYSNNEIPLIIPKPKLWPKGVVPYQIESNLANREAVEQAIEIMNRETHVRFVAHEDQKDWVVFKAGATHCYSHVGKVGGQQSISLSIGCPVSSILHEMMHTLGFFHEQNREDSDEHIMVLWENIDEKFWPQFKKIKNTVVDLSTFEFDLQSLMLYPNNAFAFSPEEDALLTIEGDRWQRAEGLSPMDIKKINFVYPSK